MRLPVDRRTALKLLASSVAASALPLPSGAQARAEKWKTAIGLNGFQSGSRKYKKNYPIWEVLDSASRHGFEGVELVGDWPSGGYPSAGEQDRVRALKRLYDAFGPDRLLWGTGFPGAARGQDGRLPLERELNLIRKEIPFLTDEDRRKILGGNAVRLWKFGSFGGARKN